MNKEKAIATVVTIAAFVLPFGFAGLGTFYAIKAYQKNKAKKLAEKEKTETPAEAETNKTE